jgi:hypothetical protein
MRDKAIYKGKGSENFGAGQKSKNFKPAPNMFQRQNISVTQHWVTFNFIF